MLCSNGLSAAETNAAGALAMVSGRSESDKLFVLGGGLGLFVTMAFLTAGAATLRGAPILAVPLLALALAGGCLTTVFARHAYALRRHTGMFVLDPARRTITQRGGDTYAFDDVLEVRAVAKLVGQMRTRQDVGWWLLLELKRGPLLRVYRGSWPEMRTLAAELAALGLPLEGDLREEDGVLLRTSTCLVRRTGSDGLVFHNPMRGFKLLSPFLLLIWTLFSAGYFYALAQGNVLVLPLCVFFGIGITVGLVNLVLVHRRSGHFVFDFAQGTLVRDERTIERLSDLDDVKLGAIGLRGVRPSFVGPTAAVACRGDGSLWLLFTGSPGDVRFVGTLLAERGVKVRELGEDDRKPAAK